MTTDRQRPEISVDEMEATLLRSGYLLEQRVRIALEDRVYYVQSSDAYPDEVTGKSRELDLSAISVRKAGPSETDFAFYMIICECINNPQPLVFFTNDQYVDLTTAKVSGLPTQIVDETEQDEWMGLSEFLKFDSFHHYFDGTIASQYCGFQKKRNPDEWMALHPEDHNDAFNAITMALETEIKQHYGKWKTDLEEPEVGDEREEEEEQEEQEVNLQFYYPLLVLQGELYTAELEEGGVKLSETQHVRMLRHHFSTSRRDSYQIDVITESFLGNYLDLVDQEMKSIGLRLQRNKGRVQKSIGRLVTRLRNGLNLNGVRAALDYNFEK